MTTVRWYHLRDGSQRGPLTLVEMRDLVLQGDVGPDTWVWADGMPTWRRAAEVPALVPPPRQAATLPAWTGDGDPAAEPGGTGGAGRDAGQADEA